jgi:hypothetical protein
MILILEFESNFDYKKVAHTNQYPYPQKFTDIRKYLSVDIYPRTSGREYAIAG